jgi:glycosyltransferase involved in cell wall biosynthesis
MSRAANVAGWHASIATTDADGSGRLAVDLGHFVDWQGVQTIFFRRRASEAFKWAPDLSAWMTQVARQYAVVHIHAVFSHTSIVAGRVCRDLGVPYIVRPLGTLDPWSLKRRRWAKQVLEIAGVRSLLRSAACIHYTSADEQRLAEQAVGMLPRGEIVPIGIDDSLFEIRSTPGASKNVVAICRLDEKKGLDLLIQAFHDVRLAHPELADWTLTLAGTGEDAYVRHLQHLANDGPAATAIAFKGWVAGPEKGALLSVAGLFALPSRQENFGIAVAEALAAGVPVLVTPHVNLADFVKTANAGWVADRDRNALAMSLASAMRDASGRASRGESGRSAASAFRWTAVGQELGALYDRVRPTPVRATA